MNEIILYYVIPNVLLFGGIALSAKIVWYLISNYDELSEYVNKMRSPKG
jgi:hypothetical protein